jgi:L-amino acid N-acyltransferase YncA
MTDLFIRPAEACDIKDIQLIYAHYVKKSLATFEVSVPDILEMQRRFDDVQRRKMPYLVCIHDQKVVGYAYANVFRDRFAYRFCIEHSIYLHPDKRGLGIGSQLMSKLIEALEPTGIRQMIAVIGDTENRASIVLHKKFGFKQIGILQNSGYKFDRWVDTVLMQRPLGEGAATPPQGSGCQY